MSKYKVGDKVVLEITDKVEVTEEPWYILSDATSIYGSFMDKAAEPLTAYIEQARADGAETAWELARKIASTAGGLSSSELVEIFNAFLPRDILSENTYPEAAAKVAKWERQKEEIKVGDILEDIYDRNVKCVVTNLYPNNMAYLVFSDGSAGMNHLDHFKKTGRHIDIDGFLRQIGEK